MSRQVLSEYCISVSMRPRAHQRMPSGAMRAANSAVRASLMKKSMSCICTASARYWRTRRSRTRSIRAGLCAIQRRLVIATTAQKLHENGQPNDELWATVRWPRYVGWM